MNTSTDIKKKSGKQFLRGQVWFVEEPEDLTSSRRENKDRVTNGCHPFLIMTPTKYLNGNDPLISGYQITSNISKILDGEYRMISADGTDVKIQCRHMVTFDRKHFKRYMYTLDESVMLEIEKITHEFIGLNS